jgi:hypothetical protein
VSNVVELKARSRNPVAGARIRDVTETRSDLRALLELQALCARAVEVGGLDAGGPTALDFTVAVHAAVQGTDWTVRFRRKDAASI